VLTPTRRAALARAWREGPPGSWALALAPASVAFRAGAAARQLAYRCGIRRTRALPVPVISIGNLTVGGTGKTPLVETVARALVAGGRRPAVLSRGYGRRAGATVAVVSGPAGVRLGVAEAGDEPLLLARRLPGVPVVVGADRARAGARALAEFALDVLVLDDGLQQRRLHADLRIVCLDARRPWGNGHLLPWGALREPRQALARADLVVLTRAESATGLAALRAELAGLCPAAPVALAAHEPETVLDVATGAVLPLTVLAGRPLLAFAGIATPEALGATLAALGVRPRGLIGFPDHHPYSAADLAGLVAAAQVSGATALVTTEKDAMRLGTPPDLPVWAIRIGLRLGEGSEAWWAAFWARVR
jgi:tetraacyldisaccharide 4'-kinase